MFSRLIRLEDWPNRMTPFLANIYPDIMRTKLTCRFLNFLLVSFLWALQVKNSVF